MGYAVMLLIVFLCHEVSSISILPHKHQTISLLKFKQSFTIDTSAVTYYCPKPYPKTSSWNTSRDCCSWDGVVCDDITGHVIELDLRCSNLTGTIDSNSSLFQLSHLQRLDLSGNNFSNSHISPEFGKFSSLKHLHLSYSYFSGQIPSEISHLSKLHTLRLSDNFLRLGPQNFEMLLQNLTQLRELHLSSINISSTIPLNFSSHLTTLRLSETGLYGIIPESIFHLPNLETLHLGFNNELSGYFPKTKWNSSASLIDLDLTLVNFSCNLPESLGYHLTLVRYLFLGSCNLRGPIPESLSNLTRIEYLYLDGNSLNGQISPGMLSLPSLIRIYLEGNQLQGHLPHSIQNLVNLVLLDLSFNNFSGRVDVSLFSNLKQLWYLSLSYNNISLTNDNNVTLPESLSTLELASCEVKELEFLRSAKQLHDLDLSNNKIQGRIPDWAWSNWMFSLSYLNISHNKLTSVDSIPLQSLDTIDLRSNLLQGSLPIPSNSTALFFISHNNLTGEIPSSICNLTSLIMLDLATNNLRGEIPSSICNLTSLIMLDLATNNLRGEIPQCFGNITFLQVLDMRHNNLSGNIPTTFINESSLSSLNLHGNKLEGKIPQSLTNCKQLEVLDLGDNHLNDTFPVWLGTLPKLKVLSLRFNKLHGPIRTSRIENMFPELRIIDLSYNAFSGNLPSSLFQHLKAMTTLDPSMEASRYGGDQYYQDSIAVVSKGYEREVVRILFLYTTIDLSNNKFEGHIPTIMGDLIALRVLNISHNGLEGPIPSSLGSLSLVESLDLSSNHLVGKIPAQFASLTSLEVFNLSYNHLEGCIPQGNQLQTFENNSYEGNDGLRGFPVTKSCGTTYAVYGQLDGEESNSEFLSDFRKAALMGYGSGLCIGISIVYFMMSTGKPIWFARIIVKLEHKIMMGRRKKQRRQRNCRRRNNH